MRTKFILALLFIISNLFASSSLYEKELTYNYRSHYNLETNQLLNVEDLASRYLDDQYQYLWIAPPDPKTPLYQNGGAFALLDYKAFDYDFLTGLVAVTNDGVRTYPVWVYETSDDSKVVIANKDGKELTSFDREKDYSSDWFVFNELFDSKNKSKDQQDWLLACYDPSRIVMHYDLIVGEDDLITYVWEQSQPNLEELFSVSISMAMMKSSARNVSSLQFADITQLTNGVQLTVEWGDATLSDDELDFFVCNDIITKNWFVEDTKEVDLSTNVYTWLDYNATNDTSRFYTCWTLYDTDGDGLSDGRETLLYGTSISLPDTDFDYMTDYEEINAGLNPNDYDDSFADPDGDGYPTLYEVKNGSDWNNEWNVPLPSWVIATNDYVDIDFVFQYFNFSPYSIIELEGGTYYENDINFNGKLYFLYAPNNDAVIDAELTGRAFVFNHLEDRRAMISGITFENGFVDDEPGGALYCTNAGPSIVNCNFYNNGRDYKYLNSQGGAIVCLGDSSSIIQNCIFTNNTADYGGAVYIDTTDSAAITNCLFERNGIGYYYNQDRFYKTIEGGAVYADGNVLIEHCEVLENHAKNNRGDACGAGLKILNGVTVDNCDIRENACYAYNRYYTCFSKGGGVYGHGDVSVINSTIVSNTTRTAGAGLYFTNGTSVVVSNSFVGYHDSYGIGTGLYSASDIEIIDCDISFNNRFLYGYGVGLRLEGNTSLIKRCNVISNSLAIDGGGVYSTGALTIEESNILYNRGEHGAGIFQSGGSLSIKNSNINFNGGYKASYGVGIYVDDADLYLESSSVIGNEDYTTSSDYIKGGGIYLRDGHIKINSCRIESNMAKTKYYDRGYGGGIYIEELLSSGTMGMMSLGYQTSDNWIYDSTIAGNNAGKGGGIYINNSSNSLALVNVSLVENDDSYGGIYLVNSTNINMLNTVCWNEETLNEIYNDNSSITGNYLCVRGGFAGNNIVTNDPGIYDERAYISSISPCYNAGTSNRVAGVDINGETRPFDGVYDIGADEYVNHDGDSIADWWEDDYFEDFDTATDSTDYDGDGISDLYEYQLKMNPTDNTDSDGDGLADDYEAYHNLDPLEWDTDGDGFGDGWEANHSGYDPSTVDDGLIDSDSDGWDDLTEANQGTDPDKKDTDGDGKWDSEDADPLNIDNDELANVFNTRQITLKVGDVSGSHSERYKVVVGPFEVYMTHVNPDDFTFSKTFRIPVDSFYNSHVESLSDNDDDGDYYATVTGDGITVYDIRNVLGRHDDTGFNSGTKNFLITMMIDENHDEDLSDKTNPNPDDALTREPINTINGDVTAADTDLAVVCQEFSLLMKRYYNSRSEYTNSPVGARWSHSFDWQLTSRTNYVYKGTRGDWQILRKGNGQQLWFMHIVDGYYKSPAGKDLRMIDYGTQFEIITGNGMNKITLSPEGKLTSIKDNFYNELTFSYSEENLSRVEHSNGQFLDYQYDGGLISRVNSSTNTLYATYAYSSAGDLTSATRHVDGEEYVTNYKYGDYHNLTNRCNALGQNFAYEYSITTNAQNIAIAKGVGMAVEDYWYKHTVEYNTNDNYSIVNYSQRGTNQIYKYEYSPYTFTTKAIYGPNNTNDVTEYIRDGEEDLIVVKVVDGESGDYLYTDMSYDVNHNVTSVGTGYNTEAPNAWSYEWDISNNNLLEAMDPEENVVTYEYRGILPWKTHTWLSENDALTTIVEHNTKGLLTKAINANGHYVEFAYNNYGFATSSVPQLGPVMTAKINDFGFVEEISHPWTNETFRTTKFYSDLIGNTTNILYADGTSESCVFDQMNNLVNSVDVEGRTTTYNYAPTHKLTSVVVSKDDWAVTNTFDYDQQFNSLNLTDALNRPVESYTMDIKDRPITVTNVEGQVMHVNYGVGSMVKSVERFDGTIVSNSYNSSGLLSQTTVGDLTNSFSYYKNALTAKVETENGSVSNIFDRANRFVSGICIADNLESSIDYMLDYAGNATNATISLDGTNIIESLFEFDEAERISQLSSVASIGDRRETNAFAFVYNDITGLTSQMTNQTSGIFVDYEFDIMNQLSSLTWKDASNNVIRSFDYSYSNSGMITNITREAVEEDTSYTYNNQGELITSDNSYYIAEYYRDAVGNMTNAKIRECENAQITVDYTLGVGNRLASWLGGGYEYNIAGCVTTKATGGISTDISWIDRYQITDVSKNGTLAKSYTYDALGRRSSITDSLGSVTKIIYDGMHMVADVDEDNNLLRTYTAGSGIDNWLSFTDHQTSNTYYYITDHVGTVHAVTDSSGTVVESYRYSPYGKVLDVFDENGNTITESAIGNRILFQGREYDYDTGFYYFRARWYDPDTGRWLSKDPIGINGGLNQYVFCGNNPVMFVDPLGLEFGDYWDIRASMDWYSGVAHDSEANLFARGGSYAAFGLMSFFGVESYQELGEVYADECSSAKDKAIASGKAAWYVVGTSTLAWKGFGGIKTPRNLNHFTSQDAAKTIFANKYIQAGARRTIFGKGVYLTSSSSRVAATLQGAKSTEAMIKVSTAGLKVRPTWVMGSYRVIGKGVTLP
jgi:RHS repeat-associated protein